MRALVWKLIDHRNLHAVYLWSLRWSYHLFTEDGHLLLTIVVEVTDHVPDLDHTHLVVTKHEVEDFLKPALELGYCLWTIFFIVSCLKSEQCLVKLGDFYTFYDDYFWWSWNAVFILHLCSSVLCSKLSVFRKVCFACIFLQSKFWLLRSFYCTKLHLKGFSTESRVFWRSKPVCKMLPNGKKQQ